MKSDLIFRSGIRSRQLYRLVFVFIFSFLSLGFSSPFPGLERGADSARLFHEGKIEEALRLAQEESSQDPQNWRAWKILGWITLMKNHLEKARYALLKGLQFHPSDTEMKRLLAICYYREGNLEAAAGLLRDIGEQWTANLLEQLEPKAFKIHEDFVSVKLNESYPYVIIPTTICRKTVPLFLDTRATFSALDRDLYKKLQHIKLQPIRLLDIIALQFWFNFAGKWSIRARTGIVSMMKIANMKIDNVPVLLARWQGTYLFPRHVPQVVNGVLGTDWMSQFIISIDYPRKELFLRKKENALIEYSKKENKEEDVLAKIPFYLTPGGQIVIEGKINGEGGNFFLVDSLDVGRAFTVSEGVIHKYHLARYGGWIIGQRRGARYPSVYAVVPKIQIGNMIMENVAASIGKNYDFPPSIDHKQGFPIGAIVGNGFFKSFVVTFDFQKMELVLKTRKDGDEKPEEALALKP